MGSRWLLEVEWMGGLSGKGKQKIYVSKIIEKIF